MSISRQPGPSNTVEPRNSDGDTSTQTTQDTTNSSPQEKLDAQPAPGLRQDSGYNLLHAQKYVWEKKKMTCQECGKRFSHGSHFEAHQKTHLGQKSFVCYECGKTFSKKFNWKRHQDTHNGDCQTAVTTGSRKKKSHLLK